MRATLARMLRIPRMHALRGAITVDADTREEIAEAVSELMAELCRINKLGADEVVSAIFTVTPDLSSAFPAEAARHAGWHDVPLLCSAEIDVPGSLPRCVRVLLHVDRHWDEPPCHVYLRAASALRPDLHAARA